MAALIVGFTLMTDQQLKLLASMTLTNSSIIALQGSVFASLVKQVLPLLPQQEQALALLSELEQLQALAADLQPSLDQAREELGLE
jgi:hypothetical protein